MKFTGTELTKWVALVLMTGDHINRYLLGYSWPILFNLGRVAMPLFMAALVVNLTRQSAFQKGAYQRSMRRLLAFGCVSLVPALALGDLAAGWWPLNILFTLLALTCILYLLELRTERGAVAAVCLFILAGGLVEFLWPALAFGVAIWFYCKTPNRWTLAALVLALASLAILNGNFWAMASIPVAVLLSKVDVKIPRVRWLFYAYYPAHLAAILAVKLALS